MRGARSGRRTVPSGGGDALFRRPRAARCGQPVGGRPADRPGGSCITLRSSGIRSVGATRVALLHRFGWHMKVLVAGDRGYVGTVLVPVLRAAGHVVEGLDLGLYEGCDLG